MKIRPVLLGILGGLIVLPLASCGSVAPVKVTAGDQCYRCRRAIADERFAAEIVAGTFVEKFRAPGCMAKYIVEHPDDRGTVFVTDYTTGKMVAPEDAFFVPLTVNANTGERDYRAYGRRDRAEAAAAELGTGAVRWTTVVDRSNTNAYF